MSNEPSDRTIILHLLRGAVPERADEVCRLWNEHGHRIEVAPSTKGATMNATRKRIKFDTKTIDFFWLLGFSSWRSIEVYAPALLLATGTGLPLDQALDIDEDRAQFEFDYKQRIAAAQSLLSAQQTTHITWPDDIPAPTAERESLRDVQEMAAFDLVALAFSFALLHEFRHVMFRTADYAPTADNEEEMACDTWARSFMTSHLANYASDHGHSYSQVEQKRAMGIALAAMIIHAMTPSYAHWETDEYPPVAERLIAMISGYNLPADSPYWHFTACLLIALMRQENRPLDIIAHSSRELVEMLLDQLR